MGLVDYSSSDSDASHGPDEHEQPPAKKPKTKKPKTSASPSASESASPTHAPPSPPPPKAPKDVHAPPTSLPPLPTAFHNLYATTVRPATADLPSLHQGRKRLIPHIQGNWPSHIYLEWHPAPAHHDALTRLLAALTRALRPESPTTTTTTTTTITSFLTSDLGAPLPLHISLSRPFVLRTEQRAAFHAALAARLAATRVPAPPLELRPDGLVWFRSAEAARSFLVLRVRESFPPQQQEAATRSKNPTLAALLAACNDVVAAHGQPRLYDARRGGNGVVEEEDDGNGGGGGGVRPVVEESGGEAVDGAFHVSVAWSFAEPTEAIRARTAAVFAREEGRGGGMLGDIRIPVDCVKVKIGNVVSEIALPGKGGKGSGGGNGLFGI